MTLLPLMLMVSLGAAPPAAGCEEERLVLLPFDTLALERPEGRQAEEAVRRAVARTAGLCLEPRPQTLERLQALGSRLAPCLDEACRAAQLKALGARWLVRGRVLGLGGAHTLVLVLVGPDGREARNALALPDLEAGAEDTAARAFSALWQARSPLHTQAARKSLRPWPQVMLGAGAAALAAGAGFGLAARATERRLSAGAGGCQGKGEAFRRCIAQGLERGRQQSQLANTLLGAGAVLGAGGALLFVWELP